MIINPARTTRHHLANQAAPAYFLIRKRSTCGKVSTAPATPVRPLHHLAGACLRRTTSKRRKRPRPASRVACQALRGRVLDRRASASHGSRWRPPPNVRSESCYRLCAASARRPWRAGSTSTWRPAPGSSGRKTSRTTSPTCPCTCQRPRWPSSSSCTPTLATAPSASRPGTTTAALRGSRSASRSVTASRFSRRTGTARRAHRSKIAAATTPWCWPAARMAAGRRTICAARERR